MPIDTDLKLDKLEAAVQRAIADFESHANPGDPYYSLSTYLPDLKNILVGVQRARSQAQVSQSPRGVLAILGGLAHSGGWPANLLNTESTIGLRLNENPNDTTWKRAWRRIRKIRKHSDFAITECYQRLNLP